MHNRILLINLNGIIDNISYNPSITPAIKHLNIVIPAKAGIQVGTGCRIKSGMTELEYLVARLISLGFFDILFNNWF